MNIKRRIYNDFFRPPLYDGYERILSTAREAGYEFHTVLSFENHIIGGGRKCFIIRRDVDTKDLKCMRMLLALEKKYGARSSCYFRWNTMDVELMKEIAEAGGESSYHYEEVATYCYKHRIRHKEEMLKHMEEIRDLFIANYRAFKAKSSQPCLTVASHGDYFNSRFHFQNKSIIDERVRKECGFIREAYDPEHMDPITCRIADQSSQAFVDEVLAATRRGEPVIELLTHPRQWNSPFWVNLKEEISRVCKQSYMGI